MNRTRSWTDEEKKEVLRLFLLPPGERLTLKQMAERFGRSEMAMKNRLQQLRKDHVIPRFQAVEEDPEMDHLEHARDLIRGVAEQLVTSRPDLSLKLNRAVLILHEETVQDENHEIIEYLKGPFQADYMRLLHPDGPPVGGESVSACLKRNIVKFKEFGQYDLLLIQEHILELYEAKPYGVQERMLISMKLNVMRDIIYRRYGLDLMIG